MYLYYDVKYEHIHIETCVSLLISEMCITLFLCVRYYMQHLTYDILCSIGYETLNILQHVGYDTFYNTRIHVHVFLCIVYITTANLNLSSMWRSSCVQCEFRVVNMSSVGVQAESNLSLMCTMQVQEP